MKGKKEIIGCLAVLSGAKQGQINSGWVKKKTLRNLNPPVAESDHALLPLGPLQSRVVPASSRLAPFPSSGPCEPFAATLATSQPTFSKVSLKE